MKNKESARNSGWMSSGRILAALTAATVTFAGQGDLDSGFGANGNGRILEVFSSSAPSASAIVQQSDGRIVVAATSRSNGQLIVARYLADGSLDLSFSQDGVQAVQLSQGAGAANAMLVQPDGKIVLAGRGQQRTLGDNDVTVVRLNIDGSLDTSFDTDGIAAYTTGGFDDFATGIVRQSDGKLVVAAAANPNRSYDFEFVRFNADGSLDNSFGSSGRTLVDFNGGDDQPAAFLQQADGALVAAGFTRDSNGIANIAVVRVSASGALDTAFGTGGKATISFPSLQSSATSIAQQSDGKLVIAGTVQEGASSSDAAIVRLAANGALDTTFGNAGRVSVAFGGKDFLSGVVANSDGTLVVTGRMQNASPPPNDIFLARFTAAGALDSSFGVAGKSVLDCGGATASSSCTPYALTRQSDGKYLVAGYDDAQTSMVLARFAASGVFAGNIGLLHNAATVVESSGTLAVAVRRTGGSSGSVTVNYSPVDGTATNGSDYTLAAGTLTWADGDSADKTISVAIINDTLTEFAETFAIQLTNITGGAVLTTTNEVVTISDDDLVSNGALQFVNTVASVGEAAGTVTLSVGRAGGSVGAVSVSYATSNGTAISGSDYTAASGTLNWADGDVALKTITVTIANDTETEADETFAVMLSSPTGGAILGPKSTQTVTIIDNDGPGTVAFTASGANVLESVGTLTLSVSRTVGSKGAITVNYATVNGTATAPGDYTASSGTLSWADADVADKTISIPIIDDTLSEPNENFSIALSSPTGGAVIGANSTATVTILANDAPGAIGFTASTLTVAETVGNAVLTVNRASGGTGAVSVQYATASGTATSGSDFTATNGTLNWAAGDFADKTISVPITADTVSEGDETFTVALSSPSGAPLNALSTATVTISANTGSGGSSGGKGGGCFIATAAFGTPMAAEVMELRVFRDHYLLQRGWGQRFVKFYYAHSPPIADFIRQHEWLRAAVRGVLRPLIWAAHRINSRATTHASQAPATPSTPPGAMALLAPSRRKWNLDQST